MTVFVGIVFFVGVIALGNLGARAVSHIRRTYRNVSRLEREISYLWNAVDRKADKK